MIRLRYARKSTTDNDRQITSIPDQLGILNLKFGSLPDENIFTDKQTAKTAGKRPNFSRMIELMESYIEKKELITLEAWKPCRLARNSTEGGKLVDWVKEEKLIVETVAGGTFDQGRFNELHNEVGTNAKYSYDISVNVKRNNDYKISLGIYPGKSPLGYKYNLNKFQGEKDHVPAHNFEQLREWIQILLTGEYTVKQSLDLMTAKGLRGKKGEPISETTTYRFLHDPFNMGLFEVKSGRNKGIYKGVHKPLMTTTEFEQLQKIITKGSQAKNETLWFMKELFRCDECGSAITGERKTKKNKNGTTHTICYSRCTKKNKNIRCSQKYIQIKDLNQQYKEKVLDVNMTPRFLEWLRRMLVKQNKQEFEQIKKEREVFTRGMNDFDKQKEDLFKMKAEGFYINNPEKYQEKLANILKLESLLQEEHSGDKSAFWRGLLEDMVDFAERLERLANTDNTAVKRQVVKILGSHLTVRDKRIVIEPRDAWVALKSIQNEIAQELGTLAPEFTPNLGVTDTVVDNLYRVRESNP